MLLEQVEYDATPEFLEELKSKICAGFSTQTHPGVAELSQIFQDKNLNPLSFPFEYLLNGSLPNMAAEETKDEPAVVFSKVVVHKNPAQQSLL